MKAKIVMILNIDEFKKNEIIYTKLGINGKYNLHSLSPFRVTFVGRNNIVADGLDAGTSLGEYIFDLRDISMLQFFRIVFSEETV